MRKKTSVTSLAESTLKRKLWLGLDWDQVAILRLSELSTAD